MTMLYCAKKDCKHNESKTLFSGDYGICQKEVIVLEKYPSEHLPAACAEYEEED